MAYSCPSGQKMFCSAIARQTNEVRHGSDGHSGHARKLAFLEEVSANRVLSHKCGKNL